MYGLSTDDLNSIVYVLEKYPEIKQAILFGSRAKGNFKNGSDVDITLVGENISHGIANEVSMELNEETNKPYRFDVLPYNSIESQDLTAHIERVGKILYQRAA